MDDNEKKIWINKNNIKIWLWKNNSKKINKNSISYFNFNYKYFKTLKSGPFIYYQSMNLWSYVTDDKVWETSQVRLKGKVRGERKKNINLFAKETPWKPLP